MKKENTSDTVKTGEQAPFADKKQWLFILLFFAIASISIFAVAMQSRDFSLSDFSEYIKEANIFMLCTAIISMLGFILFEAVALLILCRALGYRRSLWQGYIYSASDIYFSAITPSATGGQPASAYFMIKDGMNGMMSTAILVANVGMYTLSIIVIGIICLVLRFNIFLKYSLISKILIIIGFAVQIGLLIFFYMLLKMERLLQRICNGGLKLLCSMKLMRNREAKQKKLDEYMEKYRRHSKILTGHKKALFGCFIFNLLQRVSQIAVPMFVFAATTGKSIIEAIEIWFIQGYVTLGANCVPIPGAMGVSDYLMLDGFKNIMEKSQAVNLELLSRSFSFYSCVIICGVSVLIQYCLLKRRGRLK